MVASYDIETGAVRWAACEPGGGLFLMAAAAENTVWVTRPGVQPQFVAFDAATGAELWRGDQARFDNEVPADADIPITAPPLIDGVQLSGSQEGPISGTNEATREMWVQPGQLVYGDVWAVGDGAVFAVDQPALVAYEVTSGELRWRRDLPAYLWPWHVTGERLLVMWNNLQVAATDDGEVLWETTYPEPPGFPRMMGGLANTDSVFVAFTSETSGGD